PALFEVVNGLLCVPSATADSHLGDIADFDIDGRIGLNFDELTRGRGFGRHAVFLDPRVNRTLEGHRYDKTDVQGTSSAGEIIFQPTHQSKRRRRRSVDRGPA